MSLAPAPARSGSWQADPGFGVYVHIPFCAHRCHYCDFNTYEGLDALHGPYVDALVKHIEGLPGEFPAATSVFFGGGTPTLLTPAQLARILSAVRSRIGLVPDVEVTVEANPETVDESVFDSLLAIGFNRFSVGIQSLVAPVLARLGRQHGPDVARRALLAARASGVEDINADLIYGSPWETDEQWERTLEAIVELSPDHFSAYALTVEEGTPLHTLVRTGRVTDVDPDVQARRFEVADRVFHEAGYDRYEVSNWSRPGRACKHNVLYWSAGDYLGLGAGAHGHRAGYRYWCTDLPRDFIDRVRTGTDPVAGSETLADEQRASEALMLGLRLTSGIEERAFEKRFGSHPSVRAAAIEIALADGYLQRSHGRLHISPRFSFRADAVIARLY